MGTSLRKHSPKPKHEDLRKKLLEVLGSVDGEMPPEEIVAVLSYTAGQFSLFLDQRKFTVETMLELVQANVLAGNAFALGQLSNQQPKGTA